MVASKRHRKSSGSGLSCECVCMPGMLPSSDEDAACLCLWLRLSWQWSAHLCCSYATESSLLSCIWVHWHKCCPRAEWMILGGPTAYSSGAAECRTGASVTGHAPVLHFSAPLLCAACLKRWSLSTQTVHSANTSTMHGMQGWPQV